MQEYAAAFGVAGGTTLELTLAQFWSSLGDASLAVRAAAAGAPPACLPACALF